MTETLAKLEQNLRRAAESGRYDDVQCLATAFCQAAAAHLKALPTQDHGRRQIAIRIMDVLDWTLLMMLTARASCLDELSRVLVANRYLHQADVPPEKARLHL
jgi:hypothetical protein